MSAIDVYRRLTSENILERLSDLFIRRGPPEYIRSDNGPEFTAHRVRNWLENVGVKTLFIEPGSSWENRFVESFSGKLRDELLDNELFDTLLDARVLIECWRNLYNTVRLHSSLDYKPPVPEVVVANRQKTKWTRPLQQLSKPSPPLSVFHGLTQDRLTTSFGPQKIEADLVTMARIDSIRFPSQTCDATQDCVTTITRLHVWRLSIRQHHWRVPRESILFCTVGGNSIIARSSGSRFVVERVQRSHGSATRCHSSDLGHRRAG